MSNFDVTKLVDNYLSKADWKVKENSNSGYSFAGLQGFLANEALANYGLTNVYTGEVSSAHEDGIYHIHDLSHPLVGYCSGWSLEEIIKEGFSCGTQFISSTPAKHLRSLYGQLNNFIFTMTGEWAGAQALNSVDTYSAAFIKKDHMTYDQVYNELETFIYNLNVKTRIAMQSPFSNWSIDLTVPHDLKYKKAIIGGEEQDFCYGDCQNEMDMFNKALTKVMMRGDGMHKIFTFPIITYSITKEFPWDSELAEDIFTFADEANSPYFSNFINSDQDQSDVRSMCCRLRLDLRELVRASSGLFGFGDNTGSIGVVTLNLSKIAYMSKVLITYDKDDHDYIRTKEILSHYPELRSVLRIQISTKVDKDHQKDAIKNIYFIMIKYFTNLAYKSLMIKRDIVQDTLDSGMIPYTKKYLGNFSNHFNTIGVNAGHEACLNALGVGIDDPKGKQFMIDTLNYILDLEKGYQEDNRGKLLFNLEATPAEGASTRFAKKDKEDFDKIITGAGTQGDFYTNSTQLPDNYTDNIFEVFEHQNDLQPLYTSGTVQHIYMNEPVHNWKVIQSLVKKLFTNYRLPYLSISPDICVCPIHGRLPHNYKYCPYTHTQEQIDLLVKQGILPPDDKVELDCCCDN